MFVAINRDPEKPHFEESFDLHVAPVAALQAWDYELQPRPADEPRVRPDDPVESADPADPLDPLDIGESTAGGPFA